MITRDEFIDRVIDELTEGMQIPASPRRERIETIIDTVAKTFYENDDRTNQPEYIIIKQAMFQTPLFKAKRQVKLPDCVIAVTNMQTLGSNYSGNNINPDFLKTNFNYVNAITGNPSDMLMSVVNGFYISHLAQFVLKTISYDYNEFSHMITIEGRDPAYDLVAFASVKISENSLFEMQDFFDYVVGKCKVSFSRVFGFVNTKQIGNAELDVKEIKQEGKDLIEKVEKYWEELRGNADFYIITN